MKAETNGYKSNESSSQECWALLRTISAGPSYYWCATWFHLDGEFEVGTSSAIEEISLSNRGNVLPTLERNVLLDEVQHGPVQDSL